MEKRHAMFLETRVAIMLWHPVVLALRKQMMAI